MAMAMTSSAAVASDDRRRAGPLRPIQPLVVMPTPASTSSTASTVALYSPSGSSDVDDEQSACLLPQDPQSQQKQQQRRLHDSSRSSTKRMKVHRAGVSGSSPATSTRKHRSQQPRHSRKQQQQQQYRHTHLDDLECGERACSDESDDDGNDERNDDDDHSHEWQVLHDLGGCGTGATVQIVHLRHANFGLQWRSDRAASTSLPPPPPPACMVGPHWWLMASTFTVFTAAAVLITSLTAPTAGVGEALTGILLSGACLSMYAMVGCMDPGIVPRIDVPPDDSYSYCDVCASYRPHGALHCMDCRACIEGYDHHCPWTGKCVGRGNVRYFYLWLFFLVLAFVYEVIEFTTYVLPPDEQPAPTFYDDDIDGGGNRVMAQLSG